MSTTMLSGPAWILDEPRFEVVDGQRVELPPMGARSSRLASVLAQHLGPFARTHTLGRVDMEMLYLIDGVRNLQRRPDVAFVSYERWPRDKAISDDAAWDVVPDLVIEIVSPTDRAQDLLTKIREYFAAGVRAAWVISPKERTALLFESFKTIRVLTREDELDGGGIVPGFRLPMTTLFEEGGDANGPPA